MRKLLRLTTSAALLFLSATTWGQLGFEYDPNIPVIIEGDTIDNPWAGGLNYAQFSDFDYDFDGDMDLFVFDRSSNNICVFIQENNGAPYYRYEYNARLKFPSDVRYRATLVDYDNDGRKDLFTYGIGGIRVFRNTGDASNGLQWELFKDPLYSQYPFIYNNLYVSSSDIPAIADIDNDGDIDILTYGQTNQFVEYHQNQSMDLYGIPDSLEFVVMNECWGKFSEDIASNGVTLNDPNPPCVGGNISNPEGNEYTLQRSTSKHSGSTLLAFDYDSSGVMDLVIGDASYANLNLLINGGTAVNTDSPMISVDYNFPSNTTPANVELFPSPFYVDVNFDGVRDFIACPNAKNVSVNRKSVWYYNNIGTDLNPNFVYQQQNFLQDNMIEHGTGSVPVLFDYDEDGLNDLMVANFYRYKDWLDKESVIAYYRNVGTTTNPVFMLVDEDVFNLQEEPYGLRTIPAFGDVDGDGDEDMFLGFDDGTLAYYENYSVGSGSSFSLALLTYTDALGDPINTGGYCYPQVFDLNEDGLLDLVLGTKSGEIQYYENIGDQFNPLFSLVNTQLGGVQVNTSSPDGYAAPNFFKDNGVTRLFVGSIDGNIGYYDSIQGNLNPGDTFNLVNSNYLDIQVGAFSSCWVEDLDDDTILNMFVGQDLGGLYHYEVNTQSNLGLKNLKLNNTIEVYPNPATSQLVIKINEGHGDYFTITDINGNNLIRKDIGQQASVSVESLAAGIYFVIVHTDRNSVAVKRIIKQ